MRNRPLLLLISLLVLVVGPARATPAGPRLTRFPDGEIHAGDMIELEWSKPAREIQELEIVLAVDDDRRFTIRVTPELERYRNRWTWKVPELSAAHARLCVRYGEGEEEKLSAPTPEFRIVPSIKGAPVAPPVRTAWITHPGTEPDWWDESDAAPSAGPAPSLRGEASLDAGVAPSQGGIVPRRHDAAADPLAIAAVLPRGEVASATRIPSHRCTAAPLFPPLRE